VSVQSPTGSLANIFGVNARSDVSENVADLRLNLGFGEAFAFSRSQESIGQFLNLVSTAPGRQLLVGVNAVFDPEIYKLFNRCHDYSPLMRPEAHIAYAIVPGPVSN
jgi:hypothetical protein